MLSKLDVAIEKTKFCQVLICRWPPKQILCVLFKSRLYFQSNGTINFFLFIISCRVRRSFTFFFTTVSTKRLQVDIMLNNYTEYTDIHTFNITKKLTKSGDKPNPLSSLTLAWVGLVLCSPVVLT